MAKLVQPGKQEKRKLLQPDADSLVAVCQSFPCLDMLIVLSLSIIPLFGFNNAQVAGITSNCNKI